MLYLDMFGKIKALGPIIILTLMPSLLLWLPFFLRMPSFWSIPLPKNGLETIVANYDGPLYLVVAKSFYDKAYISQNFQFPLPTEYYSAHFPLFPTLIRLVGTITNYPYAMLIVTLISSIIAMYFFYRLMLSFVKEKDALFLTFLFSILPARWLIVRSTGSADPLFVGSIIASLFYFREKRYWLAGVWGFIAQLTKSPAILLFISYLFYLILPLIKNKIYFMGRVIEKLDLRHTYPILLIPFGLVCVFTTFYFTQGNFWAYFNSGDNIHLFFPPFQIFNYAAPWVGTFWLEEVLFIYIIGALTVHRLFSKNEYVLASFALTFFVLTLFISHRDLLRYSLPLIPLVYVAFAESLIKKEFKIISMLIIIPVYLYSLAFISQNVMPISNWAPFL